MKNTLENKRDMLENYFKTEIMNDNYNSCLFEQKLQEYKQLNKQLKLIRQYELDKLRAEIRSYQ